MKGKINIKYKRDQKVSKQVGSMPRPVSSSSSLAFYILARVSCSVGESSLLSFLVYQLFWATKMTQRSQESNNKTNTVFSETLINHIHS